MHINPKNTGPVRPDTASRATQPVDSTDRDGVRSVPPAPASTDRTDKVQISDAGRALAARDGANSSSGVDPARAQQIRGRVLSGAYDTLEVVGAVARRLLDTGDL